MYVECKECKKYIKKLGFKNHIKRNHKLSFLEYLEKYNINVYFKDTNLIIPSYYCQNCGSPIDEFIVWKDKKWVLWKVKQCCLNTRSVSNLHMCVFGNLNNYNPNMSKKKGYYLTKEWWIEKYGKEEGLKKRQNWIDKCKGTKENFIKRHGEEDGLKKYNDFVNKSKQTKENFIKRHGEEDGLKKYNDYIVKTMEKSPRLITYWLNKGYNYEDALIKKEEFNGRGSRLDFFIEKYGKEEGLKKWKKINKKKSSGMSVGNKSMASEECFNYIIKTLNFKTSDINFEYYIENKTKKYIDSNFFLLDFYHKKLNLWIEFYGDFWHAKNYNINEKIKFPSGIISVAEIRKKDENRINQILYDNPFLNKPMIIWESDWNNSSNLIIEEIIKKIKGIY